MDTKTLQAHFTITNGTNIIELDYEFRLTNGMSYGNGYYMWIESVTRGNYYHIGIDLRYDPHFDKTQFMAYACRWATEYWSGRNGSYRLTALTINEKGEG